MLKKKILISLVIIQGLLIIAGIIAIIFGVFYKLSNNDNKTIIMNKNIGATDRTTHPMKIVAKPPLATILVASE